jgi:integrase/recombinase XerD
MTSSHGTSSRQADFPVASRRRLRSYSYATIKRRVAAIQFVHRLSDLPSPVSSSDVYLALRRAGRTKGRRPKQVRGLTADLLEQILKSCPATLSGLRDAALISVGYDTLCRSAELAWMQVEHVDLESQTVYIPRAKNDPFADGRIAGLSERSKDLVSRWLEQSHLKEGALFRGLHTAKAGVGSLETSSIRRMIKVAAKRAGLADAAAELSGHSMRVGGAQDLMMSGHDTLMIMTAGGWKNVEVVARYVERAAIQKRNALRHNSQIAMLANGLHWHSTDPQLFDGAPGQFQSWRE